MNVTAIIFAAAVVGGTGLVVGLLLGIASEAFKVPVDEKEVAVRACLPGNNCGGCGFPGCDGLAKAIAQGEAPVNACPVAGPNGAAAIAEVMGVEAGDAVKQVAYVKCAGTCEVAKEKYDYSGVQDCTAAMVTPGAGPKSCAYGCMGLGSCVKACDFDAIHVINGIAVVDKEKCVACGKCIATCPKALIELIPYEATVAVQCNSKDMGKDVKASCSVGCIGCRMCTKVCEFDAITVENNVAHIDQSKCTGCGACAAKCPVKIIKMQ
jgi:Na+-translocating ferredoxin:NAD+ oxidoreductase RNF subunit RnfB